MRLSHRNKGGPHSARWEERAGTDRLFSASHVCCAGCSTLTTNSNNSSSSNNLNSFVLGAHPLVQEELLVGPRVLGEELEMGGTGVEVGGHPPGT